MLLYDETCLTFVQLRHTVLHSVTSLKNQHRRERYRHGAGWVSHAATSAELKGTS